MANLVPLPRVQSDSGPPQHGSRIRAEAEIGPALLDRCLNSLLSTGINMWERACVHFCAFALNEERAPQLLQTSELRLLALLLLLLRYLLLC